jgi:hypothetical protein
MSTWQTYTVIAADGSVREFYCAIRATAYARQVRGTVNGRNV